MIGFLMWMHRRQQYDRLWQQNQKLRARLAKYEPLAPPPPPKPTSGKEHFAAFLFVAGLILIVLLINAGCTTPPDRPAHFTSTRLK